MSSSAPVFCLAEDRAGAEIGIRLALLSLERWQPGARVWVFRPNPTADFRNWLKPLPQVTLIDQPLPGAWDWNCKPHALLWLLDHGHAEVVWLDSDLIFAGPFGHFFAGLDPAAVVLAEEPVSSPNQCSEPRTRGLGMTVGRVFHTALNSCVLRATLQHRPLLEHWRNRLADPEYRDWQQRPIVSRPVHCLSDQDVLAGLLGSTTYTAIPVRPLRRGQDIVHSGGALAYSAGERFRGLFRRRPPILHNPSVKPWMILSGPAGRPGSWWWMRCIAQEVSPYVAEARTYREQLGGEDCAWMDWRTWTGTGLRWAGFGNTALRGLPLTLAATVIRAVRPTAAGTANSG